MTRQEYEQKREQEWKAFCNRHGMLDRGHVMIISAFFDAFDRAYALGKKTETITQKDVEKAWQDYAKEIGLPESLSYATKPMIEIAIKQAFKAGAKILSKQEKDAEDTPISERLYEEEKSRLEGIYYYLEGAADKQEDDCVSVAILFEVMERLEDIFGIDLLTNGHVKPTPKDADTVIHGWVCRDKKDNALNLHAEEPYRAQSGYQKGDEPDWWESDCASFLPLDNSLFPDLTWDDEPIEVEIIIKRKKK